MIVGGSAIFLNIIGLEAFSILVVVGAITLLTRLRPSYLDSYSALIRCRILWLIALSPWLVGLFSGILALAPRSRWPFPDVLKFLHWHHPQMFTFYSWHGLFVFIAVCSMGSLGIRSLIRMSVSMRQAKLIRFFAEPDGRGFYRLETDVPSAFTTGFFRPCCYVTSALRRQLTDQEYLIVRLHEFEHSRQFDPLKKWLFQLLTSFFPHETCRHYNQSLALAMELAADSAVLRKVDDKSLIATTMLKVKRLMASPSYTLYASICHFGMNDIEERIGYLFAEKHEKRFPCLSAVFGAISLSLVSVLCADIFHHVVEYFLSHSH